ncbi:protein JOKA2-like [Diospyros lotus]|uniref:protein JOKA2-like n=1 Tax=Diospyros lotus TaxID=55363 RepID=UPI002257BB85|nr:protein JOKA2-like [Diospyros lotus]
MESEIVIKVKYGETLRRFNAPVNGAGQPNFNMNGLREKVLFLFKFSPDADITLTYIDEDGDNVTLIDEEDLHDAMRQSLDPLRITVKLNAEKGGISHTRLSGSCTPLTVKSPRVQDPFLNLSSSLSESLKSVPEPLQAALLKLLYDLASKAATSAPELADLLGCVSKIGQSYINPLSGSQAATDCGTSTGPPGSTVTASVTKKQEASKDNEVPSEVTPNAKFEELTYGTSQKLDLGKVSSALKASVTPDSSSVDVFTRSFGYPLKSECVSANLVPIASSVTDCDSKKEVKKAEECHLSVGAGDFGWVNIKSVLSDSHATDSKEPMPSNELRKSVGTRASATGANPMGHSTADFKNTNSGSKIACGFSTLMPQENCSAAPFTSYSSHVTSPKRSYNHGQGTSGVFHMGIVCDGCEAHPITGPRFKSKVKEDYDLCSMCFSKIGSEADYIRMDRPVPPQRPFPFMMQHSQLHPPKLPHVRRGGEMKLSQPKLNSYFVADVNVLDGTIMAPSTPFTKIWRMRNNGSMAWPWGTRLVWVGGHNLSDTLSVELRIPFDGLPVGNELEIGVDFTAPELPGRYLSYWRMATPSGQEFGRHIWVLIQVEAFLKPSLNDMFRGLNLNLPPESCDLTGSEMVNLNVQPKSPEGSLFEPDNSSKTTDLGEPMADAFPDKNRELNLPRDAFVGAGGVSNPAPPKPDVAISFPLVDLALPLAMNSHMPPPPTICVPAPPEGATENHVVEQRLLKELAEMGFKQVDLNKEILRMNKYDLEKSLDDLCGVAEWTAILEELQEMGFCDEETNKRLLEKNNGSVKRVVMDLIGRKV